MTPPITKRFYELMDKITHETINPTEKKEYDELATKWWANYDKMNKPTENFGF